MKEVACDVGHKGLVGAAKSLSMRLGFKHQGLTGFKHCGEALIGW